MGPSQQQGLPEAATLEAAVRSEMLRDALRAVKGTFGISNLSPVV